MCGHIGFWAKCGYVYNTVWCGAVDAACVAFLSGPSVCVGVKNKINEKKNYVYHYSGAAKGPRVVSDTANVCVCNLALVNKCFLLAPYQFLKVRG